MWNNRPATEVNGENQPCLSCCCTLKKFITTIEMTIKFYD